MSRPGPVVLVGTSPGTISAAGTAPGFRGIEKRVVRDIAAWIHGIAGKRR